MKEYTMWTIDKTFEFCYGHRVWTQTLDGKYSDDLRCACRHLHGHEAKVQVFMSGNELNPHGMVTDFRHLEWLKRFFNAHVDHQFIIDANDPLFESIIKLGRDQVAVFNPVKAHPDCDLVAGEKLDLVAMGINPESPEGEYAASFFVVNFPPTSENLAKWAFELVSTVMKPLAEVTKVDWWETPKSRASYGKSYTDNGCVLL